MCRDSSLNFFIWSQRIVPEYSVNILHGLLKRHAVCFEMLLFAWSKLAQGVV